MSRPTGPDRQLVPVLSLDLHLGPVEVSVAGRALDLCVLTVALLAVSGVLVAWSGRPELRRRWSTWVLIAPVVGGPLWLGPGPTAALAAALAVQAVREFVPLVGLGRAQHRLLLVLAVAHPLAAWLRPELLALAPLAALACAVPSLAAGDVEQGLRRSAAAAFGSVWLCWTLAHLVVLRPDAFLICLGVAAADVGAWCGGRGLRRLRWAARPLSPLSPGKTVGGLAGALVGAGAVLAVLGAASPGLVLAVGLGSVAGDLLESMVKRQAGAKDAGAWLPGFGGLLDRVDSLLLALPLAAVLA